MRRFWQIILGAVWAVIFLYWYRGSGELLFNGGPLAAVALGRLAGLAAAFMILLQFFFMGRLPYLERAFGLDRLSRLHHTNGQWGLVLLLVHPVLITLGYAGLSGTGFFAQFASFFFEYEHIPWAVLGLTLFIVVVASSLYIVQKRLRYESWYFVHLLAYGAVFSSFWHQIRLGEDLLSSQIFWWFWVLLYIAVFAVHLVFRILRPLWLYRRHGFFVQEIRRETPSAVSIYISGRDLDRFSIQPGQFMILRFLTKDLWWQAHPFSLSLLPDGRRLRVTVKELGDFTKRVADIPVGTKILVDGPYGVFTDLFSVSRKILLIAGGIGITPIRSLMEQMACEGKDLSLIYANRTEKDIVFKEEIESLAERYGAKVTHVISEDPSYPGEKGRVDAEKLKKLVPDLASREVYLCGPPPMMDSLLRFLEHLGIPSSRIHYERFSL